MRELTQAIYTALASDANLIAMLAQYNGYPAVFTSDPAPNGATFPFIVSAGQTGSRDAGTKSGKYRIINRDIRCYDDNTGAPEKVELIADRVVALFHKNPSALNVANHTVIILDVTGSIALDDPDAFGRIVSLEIHIMEN